MFDLCRLPFLQFDVLCVYSLCICQIEASTCPPPPGIPRAFDSFAVPGRREFDYQSQQQQQQVYSVLPFCTGVTGVSLLGGGEFDPHALGVGNLNCTLDFM